MAISDIQIKACYDAALDMRDRKIGISDAKRQVESRSAMSQGSAMDYIYNVQKLLQGQCYTRTMNVVGTELILSWIHADFGEEAAFVAAHTVLEHVVYYSNLKKGGPQDRIRRLAEKKIATLTHLMKVSQKMDEFRGDFQADIANSQQDTKEARQMQPLSQSFYRAGQWASADDHVELTYDARFLRRKVLISKKSMHFLVDLEHTTSLNHGDAFELTDGRLIEVVAAMEDLFEVTGDDLTRIAWHIGNRHTPCQIEPNRLVIQRDHVIRDMLRQIGAEVREITEPFVPEGGAYGHGRTHDHSVSQNHEH